MRKSNFVRTHQTAAAPAELRTLVILCRCVGGRLALGRGRGRARNAKIKFNQTPISIRISFNETRPEPDQSNARPQNQLVRGPLRKRARARPRSQYAFA